MAKKDKSVLKGYFETGKVPTESNFEDLIDSMVSVGDVDQVVPENPSESKVPSTEAMKGYVDGKVENMEREVKEELAGVEKDVSELGSIIHNEENPEFAKVEIDSEGKILSSIDKEGNKKENLPTEFTDTLKVKGRDILSEIDSKQDNISDLEEIRSKANSALQEHQDISFLASKEEVVEQGGKIDELGVYEDNPEFLRVYVDRDGRFLWGIRNDGSIEWAKGVPTPVKEHINASLSEIISNLDKKADIVEGKGFSTNDFTNALKEKLEDINLQPIINKTDSIEIQNSTEFAQAVTDSEGHLLESRDTAGRKTIHTDLKVEGDISGKTIEGIIKNIDDLTQQNFSFDQEDYVCTWLDGFTRSYADESGNTIKVFDIVTEDFPYNIDGNVTPQIIEIEQHNNEIDGINYTNGGIEYKSRNALAFNSSDNNDYFTLLLPEYEVAIVEILSDEFMLKTSSSVIEGRYEGRYLYLGTDRFEKVDNRILITKDAIYAFGDYSVREYLNARVIGIEFGHAKNVSIGCITLLKKGKSVKLIADEIIKRCPDFVERFGFYQHGVSDSMAMVQNITDKTKVMQWKVDYDGGWASQPDGRRIQRYRSEINLDWYDDKSAYKSRTIDFDFDCCLPLPTDEEIAEVKSRPKYSHLNGLSNDEVREFYKTRNSGAITTPKKTYPIGYFKDYFYIWQVHEKVHNKSVGASPNCGIHVQGGYFWLTICVRDDGYPVVERGKYKAAFLKLCPIVWDEWFHVHISFFPSSFEGSIPKLEITINGKTTKIEGINANYGGDYSYYAKFGMYASSFYNNENELRGDYGYDEGEDIMGIYTPGYPIIKQWTKNYMYNFKK